MFKSTNIQVENSIRALRALPIGQILTDEHGNFFERAGDKYGKPRFHVLWRNECWESGFAPVQKNRSCRDLECRALYLAEQA